MSASWACSAGRSYSIDKTASWDGGAAESSIWEWAGFGGDSPDSSKAAKCFLAHDSSAGDKKGSYKLPFVMIRDGKPVAILAGLHAAAARLSNTDIPAAVKTSAQAVIDAYDKKAGAADGESDRSAEDDEAAGDTHRGTLAVYAYRVPVLRAKAIAPPDPNETTFDPDIFKNSPPFVFRAEISNENEDAFYTRMHASSLRNYAREAEVGVALQNSHRSMELPLGHSYRGQYLTAGTQPDAIARTHADFYVLPDLNLNGVPTNDFIRAVQGRVVRDVSVGFFGGSYRCTLCNRDLWDRDCEHIPGLSYKTQRAGGEQEERAAAWIHDAHLAEVSATYDGATPGASIIKAQQMGESGRLNQTQARFLETQYRIKLPGTQRFFAGVDALAEFLTTPSEETRMVDPLPVTHDPAQGLPPVTDPDQGLPPTGAPAEPDGIAALLTEAGLEPIEENRAAVRTMLAEFAARKTAPAEPPAAPPASEPETRALTLEERDRALATEYRTKIVEQARTELVRAFQNNVDAEFHVQRWMQLPLADVERERDHYVVIAAEKYPRERVSSDNAQARESSGPVPQIPDFVYSSGVGLSAANGRKG